ncbi:MAG: hypothetical protein LBR93_01980 [Treponema sp.]|nr:hypothetical protein [Treponema sp.]
MIGNINLDIIISRIIDIRKDYIYPGKPIIARHPRRHNSVVFAVAEFTDKAITGAINIDAEWDAYIRNLRRMGGDRKIQLSTEWYNRTFKK